MKKQNVKKTVLKEEELTKVVGGSTAHVGFNFLSKKLWNNIWKRSVSYTHLTLPTIAAECRSRWSPYH